MNSSPPRLKGLYRIGKAPTWKLTSPQDAKNEFVFIGTEKEAKKIANRLFTDHGNRPRIRLLGSV